MPRRLCEPLCVAFGTSVSSPTAPTYQLYDLPHKLKPRLYMEAREPWRVVREMKEWKQAATAEAISFLHDLLADGSAHDTFYVHLPVPGASNRCRVVQGIVVQTSLALAPPGLTRGSADRQIGAIAMACSTLFHTPF